MFQTGNNFIIWCDFVMFMAQILQVRGGIIICNASYGKHYYFNFRDRLWEEKNCGPNVFMRKLKKYFENNHKSYSQK